MSQLERDVEVLITKLERELFLAKTEMAQHLIRKGSEHFKIAPPCNSCTTASCCSLTTVGWLIEALPIARHLRRTGKDSPELRARLRAGGEDMESYTRAAWMAKNIPCPFLVEGRCSIYALRPGCCALHFVWNGPEACVTTNTTVATETIESPVFLEWLHENSKRFVRSIGIEPHDVLYSGSIGRMVALALEMLASPATMDDIVRREPFPTYHNIGEWLEGNNPFGDRRKVREAAARRDRPRSDDEHGPL